MEIDLHVHLVAADYVVFYRMHAIALEGDAVFYRTNVESIADEILILKNGRLRDRGTVSQLVSEISGKVWECEVTEYEANKLEETFIVSNRRQDGQHIVIRIVSEQAPISKASLVSPTLEDLYLYYFREEMQDEDTY